mmetsp:Transcript_27997/g.78297  ORF Transcript_27997/g.78297 Transcript_27997/m.78297 type:complete len:168 (+) Transcript_27997:102-605(+)|eukprot:CAMPEP_0119132528 /NCGR_PEP_ID=MMETSP1310-20130426/11885_1 /TAXON_ID=464262 /ORGANISM="Genus nov. species nov., Strain RCC2339" /LENGTH=167 /DNA_ID=CAMNT_0007123165 /DNA_START=70 /DNA_END=573 /DNA_ORIENTATION=+
MKEGGEAKLAGLCCAIFFGLIFGLAPSLTWLIVGSDNLDTLCVRESKSPDLATWLTVQGAVGVFLFAAMTASSLMAICAAVTDNGGVLCCAITLAGLQLLLMILCGLFSLAWLIVGAVRLSEDKYCEQLNSTLYNCTLAAIIIGFVGVILNLCNSLINGGGARNNDN